MRYSRGDTIIEVMFSFVVFSLLTVGTYIVMNRGTQIAQRSLEITLVRQQLDAQVSLIRYVKDTNPAQWAELTSSKFLVNNPLNVDLINAKTYGVFAQIVRAEQNSGVNTAKAYDVYVNACWDSVGAAAPLTIGTVTRIYDK